MPYLGKRSAKNEISSNRGKLRHQKFHYKPGQQYIYHHKDSILNYYEQGDDDDDDSDKDLNDLDLFGSHESSIAWTSTSKADLLVGIDSPDKTSELNTTIDNLEFDHSIPDLDHVAANFEMDSNFLEPNLLAFTDLDDNDSALLRLQEEMEIYSSQSDLIEYARHQATNVNAKNPAQDAPLPTESHPLESVTLVPQKVSIPSFVSGHKPTYASWSLYYGQKEISKKEHFWCCVCDIFCESVLLDNNKLDENQILKDYYYMLDLYLFEKFLGSIQIQSSESYEMQEYCSDITTILKCFAVSLTEMLFRQQVQEMQLVHRTAQQVEKLAPAEMPKLDILLCNTSDCSFLVSQLTDPKLLKSNFLGKLICLPIRTTDITMPLHLQIVVISSTWKCTSGCGETTNIFLDLSMRGTNTSSDTVEIYPASVKGVVCKLCGKKNGLELLSTACDTKLLYTTAVRPSIESQEVTTEMNSTIVSQIQRIQKESDSPSSHSKVTYWTCLVREKKETLAGSTKKGIAGICQEPYSLVLDVLQVSGQEKKEHTRSYNFTQSKRNSTSHVFEKIVCSFARNLVGRDLYKAALLLWMACPIKLLLLLCGDPSTGKTTLLKACQSIMPFNQSNTTQHNNSSNTANKNSRFSTCAVEDAQQLKSIKIAQLLLRSKSSVIMTATPLQGHFNYAKSFDENFGWHESSTTSSTRCPVNSRLFDLNLFFKDDPEANRHGDRLLAEYLLSTKGSTSMAASSTTESFKNKAATERLDLTITGTNPKGPSQTLFQRILKLQATNSIFFDQKEIQNILLQSQNLAINHEFQQVPDENVKNLWDQGAMADLRRFRLISGLSIGRACIEGRRTILESDVRDVLEIIQFIDEQRPQQTGKGSAVSGRGKEASGKGSAGRGKSGQWKVFASSLEKGCILTSCQLRNIAQECGLEHLLDNWPACVESLNQQGIIIKISSDTYRVT